MPLTIWSEDLAMADEAMDALYRNLSGLRNKIATALAAQREAIAKMCDAADKSTHPAKLADRIRKNELE